MTPTPCVCAHTICYVLAIQLAEKYLCIALKDCEDSSSLKYIRMKNYLNLRSYMWLLVVCYLQELWNELSLVI